MHLGARGKRCDREMGEGGSERIREVRDLGDSDYQNLKYTF